MTEKSDLMPYRLDLAGGWLDQPFVSSLCPGPVVNVSLEPTHPFASRSGLSYSTREHAVKTWGQRLPQTDVAAQARALYEAEGGKAGSQDAIGIVYPGIKRLDYAGREWPELVTTICDEAHCRFIESHLYLIFVGPRPDNFHVLDEMHVTAPGAKSLSDAAKRCWTAIEDADLHQFGNSVTDSFHAQLAMFPKMKSEIIEKVIDRHGGRSLGHKVAGAGGGGYVIFVADRPIDGALRIKIRR